MALRLTHFAYATVIFLLVTTALTFVINNTDIIENVNSGVVNTELNTLKSNLSGVQDIVDRTSNKTDVNGNFLVGDNDQIDTRGDDVFSVWNLLTKNIVIQYFNQLSEELGFIDAIGLFSTIITLIGLAIIFMFYKAIREKKS